MKRKAPVASKAPPSKRPRTQGDYQKGRETLKSQKELKAFDLAQTNLVLETPANPPNFVLLNACVNGAELYQRVGRKIYMKSIHIRGFLQCISTSGQDMARIIVFYDAQPNAAAPTIAALLQDSNAAAATTFLSEINLNNRQRFKILRDHQVLLPSSTLTGAVQTNTSYPETDGKLQIDFFIKLKGLEAVYNATNGGTIADITSGSIYIVAMDGVDLSDWELTFTSRLRYYD